MSTLPQRQVRFWVAGDLNGFFGLFTNVLLNVIVLTGLCLGVVQLPADTVFGRILPALGIALAARQPLLRVSRLAARQEGRPQRRDRDAVRPERAAHVHRRVPDHAADVPGDQGPARRLACRPRLVLHHRRHRADRRLRRAADSRADAARRDARHAGRHLDRVHLDAPRIPDVGSAVDRLRVLRARADRLDREHPAARRPSGRACRRDRRLGDRLGRRRSSAGATTCSRRRVGKVVRAVRPAPALVLDGRVAGTGRGRRRCSSPRSRSASTTSPRG